MSGRMVGAVMISTCAGVGATFVPDNHGGDGHDDTVQGVTCHGDGGADVSMGSARDPHTVDGSTFVTSGCVFASRNTEGGAVIRITIVRDHSEMRIRSTGSHAEAR